MSDQLSADPISTVVINGVPYVPRDTVISAATMGALHDIYCIIGGELYDPENDSVLRFAKRLWEPIRDVNDMLRFKK